MIILPDRRTMLWNQNNRSDVLGTLWSSFNLNLTEQLGKTKVSPRMVITTNGIANFGTPVAFREYGGDLYCVAGNFVWKATGGLLETTFVQFGPTNGNVTMGNADYEVFNNHMYITVDTAFDRVNTDGTFSSSLATLTSSHLHKLLYFPKTNRLYIQSSNTQIISMDTSETVATISTNTFTLPDPTSVIVSMIATSSLIWILTLNQGDAGAKIYTWDGITANTPTDVIPTESRGVLAGVVKDGTPYIIDTDGKLMYYNGQALILSQNGRLPVKQFKYLTNPISLSNNRFIHPNGITIIDNRINILINNLNNDGAGSIQESLPSGIWEYDSEIGWYHKSALTQYDYSGAQSIIDFGQNRLSRVGALWNYKSSDTTSGVVGTMIVGADYYVDTSTIKSAAFTNDSLDTIQKRGYLVTNKILSEQIQDNWQKLYLKIRPLLNTTDFIKMKYRSNDDVATEVTITWVNTSSFTTTGGVGGYVAGNEVEILSGNGSGWCPNIKSITNNAGTYTVVLDETFPGSNPLTSTAKARFQTWQNGGIFNSQTITLAPFGISRTSPWIQIKLCFCFTGNNEMINMKVVNTSAQ